MEQLFLNLRYWLVDQPMISQYEWKQGETWGASHHFLFITVLTYLSTTFLLSHTSFHYLHPTLLRLISAVHNLILLTLSLIMAVGSTFSTLSQMPNLRWTVCFPVGHTPPRGPTFFWAHVFYFSKIIEFIDTLLIISSGDNGRRRLSFLHVYHHAVVVIMCYLWLHTVQSLFPVALVINALVHVLMYAYYLLCALGKRPKWKRLVTNVQITQFGFSFVMSGVMLYFHFSGFGCSGFLAWCFNALFNASLLFLFLDFHGKNYATKKLS